VKRELVPVVGDPFRITRNKKRERAVTVRLKKGFSALDAVDLHAYPSASFDRYLLKLALALYQPGCCILVIFTVIELAPGGSGLLYAGDERHSLKPCLRCAVACARCIETGTLSWRWVGGLLQGISHFLTYRTRSPTDYRATWVSLPLAALCNWAVDADRVSSGYLCAARRGKAGDVGVMGPRSWVFRAEFWFARSSVLDLCDQSALVFRRWL